MEVNFDQLRIKGAKTFNKLVNELNRHINGEFIREGNPNNDALVVGDIYDEINTLREVIITLLCLEDEKAGIKSIDLDVDVFAPDQK